MWKRFQHNRLEISIYHRRGPLKQHTKREDIRVPYRTLPVSLLHRPRINRVASKHRIDQRSHARVVSRFFVMVTLCTRAKKARRALSITPFLLGMIILAALYYYPAHLYFGTPTFDFWILIVVTLFTLIALARAKKCARILVPRKSSTILEES